jgi:uncharacterized protein YidB (DUF937 family)
MDVAGGVHCQEAQMGLLDVINGMQNGPRGASQPSTNSGGGMSPITMALMGLLAYKAMKSFGGSSAAAQPQMPSGGGLGGMLGGGGGGSLGDVLAGGLGGLFGGGGSSVGGGLSKGLGSLISDLQNSGQGHVAQSWVGTGPNQPISPSNLESALGSDAIDALTKQTGMERNELLSGMSQYLPGLVDHLTPDGRLPTADEAGKMS